MRSKTTSKKF